MPLPFGLKLKRTRRYTVSSKSCLVARIQLLNNEFVEFTLSVESTGQESLEAVAQRLELREVSCKEGRWLLGPASLLTAQPLECMLAVGSQSTSLAMTSELSYQAYPPIEEGTDTEQVFPWRYSIREWTVPEFWIRWYIFPKRNSKPNMNAFWIIKFLFSNIIPNRSSRSGTVYWPYLVIQHPWFSPGQANMLETYCLNVNFGFLTN